MTGDGFECDHCHTKVVVRRDMMMSKWGAVVPDGWLVLATGDQAVEPWQFCSWGCLAAHAAPHV